MQQGSRNSEDKDATRIKTQRGSRCNEDQGATRIKMQGGLRCNKDHNGNEDQDAVWVLKLFLKKLTNLLTGRHLDNQRGGGKRIGRFST